ncbi:MAG: 4'-phosphopantetheinyl transferase superfamily protein [Bacteroidia bacterium]|nr:4'-phosphopantetheinyl transferase superfamily protein [Bacteroidia bacterium]MCX7652428.1 4'-phosphopantetheinyl transferase superfamily protein [Bacteroidia bacterium]MDW8417339.1 4'-phosphopantetheinyl transferase superfamily protein [Bacteroidia bacterium]
MSLSYTGEWNGIAWAVWKIEESEEHLWKIANIPPEEEKYLQQISHQRRRLESIAARAARACLPPGSFFSLSHSFPWAAAATAPVRVGIDIERFRPFPAQIWSYFTQDFERQTFEHSNFTKWHFWCAKEVSFKILRSKYDNISFSRELVFDGERVIFKRGNEQRVVRLHFIQSPEWLMGLGIFEESAVD